MAQLVSVLAAQTEFSARVSHDEENVVLRSSHMCFVVCLCVDIYTQNKINNKCKKEDIAGQW